MFYEKKEPLSGGISDKGSFGENDVLLLFDAEHG